MKRFIAACAVVAIATLGIDASAGAYPPSSDLVLSTQSTSPGAEFTALFTDCDLGETVLFTIQGDSGTGVCVAGGVGEARALAGPNLGSASTRLTAPSEPGTYIVTAVGQTSGRTGTMPITVAETAPAPAPAPVIPSAGNQATASPLPTTGSDSSLPILRIGGALLLAGLGLATVVYRRRPVIAAH